ncbi:EscU/YscU/HrcU family type III secretion system export apparatus switch protein [Alkalihalobacillus sp. 1P02AB]|uniref:EscU/YscU/HrcU family type III secretion system export apparatus switch protein n=1 Tax=Alkalihalobacillus sp. 1P02AB TaxID=3132260 RepID=UPI0039A52A82
MKEQTNTFKQAVALKYLQGKENAPKVSAKGKGFVADEIIKRAKEADIPIQEDVNLVQMLSELELNETIPEELYQVVAEVFAFIYLLDKNYYENEENTP